MSNRRTMMAGEQSSLTKWASRYMLYFVALVGLASYMFVYHTGGHGSPIRADGAGYYMYLPSYIIHADPTFERVAETQYGGRIPGWTGVVRSPVTGHYENKFNVGVAVMMTPFFLLAHVVSLLSGSGIQGYEAFYQHAASLSGMFYMLLGLSYLRRVMERCFSTEVTLITLMVMLFGTNLFHYGTGESVMTHTYSFCLFSMLMYFGPQWLENPASWRLTLGVGLVCGLIPLVRVVNIVFLSVWLLHDVTTCKSFRQRCVTLLLNWKRVLVLGLVAFVSFLPQMLIWKYTSGSWLYNSYGDRGLPNLLHPEFVNVLFSVRKGVFFYSPILVLSVVGLPLFFRKLPAWALGVSVYVILNVYLISSSAVWWAGSSFGHRYFVESYAVLALPMACTYARLQSTLAKAFVACLSLALVAYSLFLMYHYWIRAFSIDGLDWPAFFDLFWAQKQHFLQWFGSP